MKIATIAILMLLNLCVAVCGALVMVTVAFPGSNRPPFVMSVTNAMQRFRVECSDDLTNWFRLFSISAYSNTNADVDIHFEADADAAFFRIVEETQ